MGDGEGGGIIGDAQVALGRQDGAGRKREGDGVGQRPSAQIDGCAGGVVQFNPFFRVFHVRQELRAPVVHDFINDDRCGECDLIGRAGGDVAGSFGGEKFTRDGTGERGASQLVRLRLHSDGINDG